MSENLWGQLPEAIPVRTPAVILREQAAAIQQMTNGIVVGEVRATKAAATGLMQFELRLAVPALNNYRLRVCMVEYPIISYPCKFYDLFSPDRSKEGRFVLVADADGFKNHLAVLLSNQKLLLTISNLIAQALALDNES